VTGKENLMAKKISTKQKNALFELGLEEIPARFMPGMLADLKDKAKKELEAARLPFKSVETYGTPRRLVLYIEGLPEKQRDLSKEIKGPTREAAFGKNGTPTPAAEGFAKSHGISISDLKIKKVGEKEFVFALATEKGLATEKILERILPQIIKSLYLPISMRWGKVDYRFVRPIHWIFAACGSKVLNLEIAGIKASNSTYGHRSMGLKPIPVSVSGGITVDTLKKALLKGRVVLDQDERKKRIIDAVKGAAKKLGGEALIDNDLLDEVNFLVEWPEVISGGFRKDYLELPKDVLVTTMKKNQKYFSVIDQSGGLLPFFICVTNGIRKEDARGVREGNEKVLTARLSDAKFFFTEDRKKPLDDRIPGLAKVSFYEKLGTVYEKVERITALSGWIAKELKLPDRQKENINEIARLCKADLLTQMVYEFPELQGVMGREYSLLEGQSKDIAVGISEHYLPRHMDDKLPSSMEGAVVGIADKIDSIVGCFSIGLIPSGSEDPFALRRQAHGIVSVILDKKTNLALDLLTEKAYKLYEPLFLGEIFTSGKVKYNDVQKVIPEVLSFIASRVKNILLDGKIRYDVAEAVLSNFEDVLDSCEKAKVIEKALKQDWFKGIVFTADRVTRLAVNSTRENVTESDFITDDERSLHELHLSVNFEVGQALEKGDYEKALKELSRMTKPVDDFFVKVMVMDKDEKLKTNRLALLKTIERMYLEVADFPKIVM